MTINNPLELLIILYASRYPTSPLKPRDLIALYLHCFLHWPPNEFLNGWWNSWNFDRLLDRFGYAKKCLEDPRLGWYLRRWACRGLQRFAMVCRVMRCVRNAGVCKGSRGLLVAGIAGVCKGLQSICTFINSFNSLKWFYFPFEIYSFVFYLISFQLFNWFSMFLYISTIFCFQDQFWAPPWLQN